MKKIYTSVIFLCFLVNFTSAQCNLTFTPHTSSICHGNCATVTVSGANTYLWMPGGLTGSVVTLCPTVTTIYTVTGTDGSSNTCSAKDTIIVNPNPVVTPTATPSTVCAESTTHLSATSSVVGTTYVWNPGGLNGNPILVSPSSTTIYTVTGTSPAVCTGSNYVTVTVTPNVIPTFNPIPPINSGGSFTLQTTSINGITGTWLPAPNNTVTTTYTFTPTEGQCATIVTLTVVVNPSAIGENIADKTIMVYPNPSYNIIFVEGFENTVTVDIYDLNGKLLLSNQLNANKVDINPLAKGLYFIKLSTAEGSMVGKFVKE
jgi:hypothetical protein